MRAWVLIALGAALPGAAAADPLSLTVSGAGPAGTVQVALFADADSFAARTGAVHTLAITPEDGVARAALDLPPGRYAAAVYQDFNGDGQLTTDWVGMPVEPFGFSGAPARYGPPSFADAAFAVPETVALDVHLEKF